jgi:hypothetical protein
MSDGRRTSWQRAALRTGCVAWLVLGIFRGVEGFGLPAHLVWRPLAMVAFLVVNAFAAAVVVAECIVLMRPQWESVRIGLTKVVMLVVFVVSLVHYLLFLQSHAVLY